MTLLLPQFAATKRTDIDALVGRVHHTDALTLMRAMPSNSVDMVFIDPPYGNDNGGKDLAGARARDKVKGGRQRGEIKLIENDTTEAWERLMLAVLPEINRVLKPVGVLCSCMGGGGGTSVLFAKYAIWLDTYLNFFHAVVWDKSKRGDGMGWRYRRGLHRRESRWREPIPLFYSQREFQSCKVQRRVHWTRNA